MRNVLHEIDAFSPDYQDLLKRILYQLQQITIAQLGAERYGGEVDEAMRVLAQRLPVELVQLWYQIATDGWQSLAYQPDVRLAVEMILLRMIALYPLDPEKDPSQVMPVPEPECESVPDVVLDTNGAQSGDQMFDGDAGAVEGVAANAAVVSVDDVSVTHSEMREDAQSLDYVEGVADAPPWLETPPSVSEVRANTDDAIDASSVVTASTETQVDSNAVMTLDDPQVWLGLVKTMSLGKQEKAFLYHSAVVRWAAPVLTLGVDESMMHAWQACDVECVHAALSESLR